jgi:hypothetical protein
MYGVALEHFNNPVELNLNSGRIVTMVQREWMSFRSFGAGFAEVLH